MFRRYLWTSVLSRYISREFIIVFLLSICAFNVIYLVIDFFQSVDKLLEHKAPLELVLSYYLLKMPMITFQTLPLAVLLSTLITLGILSRHMEITAMKASGISLYRITKPVILISIAIAFVTFFGNEYLAPYSFRKSQHIMDVRVLKRNQRVSFKNLNIWYRDDSSIYNFQAFDPERNTLDGITVYLFGEGFQLHQRVDAHDAVWEEDRWILNDVTIRSFRGKEPMAVEKSSQMVLPMNITPETLRKVEKDTEEMGYGELKRYVRRLQRSGYDATKYLVDLKIKISLPIVNLIMVLIGIPFALKTGRTGGFAAGIGISLAIGLVYWILISVSRAFGHSGILPPLLSAWSPHVLFGGAGIVALLSIRQ
ncbi:MAG: LPS export ABC transporter permease LptG [Proteobacteria bacterium]|nr:LPS export ABC transporter permease LptG [Pseudomonadota bacterium]